MVYGMVTGWSRDAQWERLKALGLPGDVDCVGVTAHVNRLFVEAVLYRYRAGIPWRDLPPRFGPWHAVYLRFDRWSKQGVWERVFAQLSKEADNTYAMIDSSVVRAHRSAAGARKETKGAAEAEAATNVGKKGALPSTNPAKQGKAVQQEVSLTGQTGLSALL